MIPIVMADDEVIQPPYPLRAQQRQDGRIGQVVAAGEGIAGVIQQGPLPLAHQHAQPLPHIDEQHFPARSRLQRQQQQTTADAATEPAPPRKPPG